MDEADETSKPLTFYGRLDSLDLCERVFEYDLAQRMAVQTAIFEDWSILLS